MYFSFNLYEKFCEIGNTGQLYIFSDEYLNPPKYDLLSIVLLEDLGERRGWGSMSRSVIHLEVSYCSQVFGYL